MPGKNGRRMDWFQRQSGAEKIRPRRIDRYSPWLAARSVRDGKIELVPGSGFQADCRAPSCFSEHQDGVRSQLLQGLQESCGTHHGINRQHPRVDAWLGPLESCQRER